MNKDMHVISTINYHKTHKINFRGNGQKRWLDRSTCL